MTVTEGGGRRAVGRKFQEVFLPALKANFMLWPAVQILNFRVIPRPFQIVSLHPMSLNILRAVLKFITVSPLSRLLALRGRRISLSQIRMMTLYDDKPRCSVLEIDRCMVS